MKDNRFLAEACSNFHWVGGWENTGRVQYGLHGIHHVQCPVSKNYICDHLWCSFKLPLPLTLYNLPGPKKSAFVPRPSPPHATQSYWSTPKTSRLQEVTHAYERTCFFVGVDCFSRWTLYCKTSLQHCQPRQASNSTHNMFFFLRGWFVRPSIEYWLTWFGFS